MNIDTVFQVAGFTGVAFYLGSYAALQAGVIRGSGYLYASLNLIASTLVLLSLFGAWNLWSAIIQISWITISIVGMTRVWLLRRALRFSPEEEEMVAARFATMDRIDARRLINKGHWRDGKTGEVLTTQGMPVRRLTYVAQGGVDIVVDDEVIAHVGSGEFIGEMACLTEGAASATVFLNQGARLFQIATPELQRLVRRHPELGPHLDYAFAHNTKAKLKQTNAILGAALRRQRQSAAAE